MDVMGGGDMDVTRTVIKPFNKDEEVLSNLTKLYHNHIGFVTPMIADELIDAVDEYPADWFEPAFREMARNNASSWNYVHAILKRWKKDGFKDRKKTTKASGLEAWAKGQKT
jgi:DnaD/phage-associated family protein